MPFSGGGGIFATLGGGAGILDLHAFIALDTGGGICYVFGGAGIFYFFLASAIYLDNICKPCKNLEIGGGGGGKAPI